MGTVRQNMHTTSVTYALMVHMFLVQFSLPRFFALAKDQLPFPRDEVSVTRSRWPPKGKLKPLSVGTDSS